MHDTKRVWKNNALKSCLSECCIRLYLESQSSNVIRWSSWNMYRDDEWFKVKTHREIPGPLSLAFMRWALLNYLMALVVWSVPQYLKCPSKHAKPCVSLRFDVHLLFFWGGFFFSMDYVLICWSGSSGPVFPREASVGGLQSVTPQGPVVCAVNTQTHTPADKRKSPQSHYKPRRPGTPWDSSSHHHFSRHIPHLCRETE